MRESDTPQKPGALGTGALTSIGIGGMIGGGIFAVTGLTIDLTKGAAPIAFVIAGVVALLTSWSYLRLSLRFPSSGGTVEFLNRAFGPGASTGSLSILLCFGYVVLLAVYAYAFGSYGAGLFHGGVLARRLLAGGVLVALALVNFLGPRLVIRSENAFNVVKLVLLVGFIVAALAVPGHWSRVAPGHWVAPLPLVAGAMVIFLNYEGFELIANAAPQAKKPRRALPIAFLGGTTVVLVVYVLIATGVLLHLDFATVAAHSDNVLSEAAGRLAGRAGTVGIVVAALAATASAINATFYGSGRLTYLIAKYGELPAEFEHDVRKQPVEGMVAFAALAVILTLFVPLSAIATVGSASFLIIFAAVNLANLKLARETGANRGVAVLGLTMSVVALVALVVQTGATASTRWQLVGILGLVAGSVLTEVAYRSVSGRSVHMGHRSGGHA